MPASLAKNPWLAAALVLGATTALAVSCAEDRFALDADSTQPPPVAPGVVPAENTNELCSDGIDNDQDGVKDCCDLDCDIEVWPDVTICEPDGSPEVTMDTCFDCIDNDENGFMDCNDFSCSMNNPNVVCPTEDTNELCSDEIDNDGNGFTDCKDFDCSMNPDVTVCE